jgi:hypothetical protein
MRHRSLLANMSYHALAVDDGESASCCERNGAPSPAPSISPVEAAENSDGSPSKGTPRFVGPGPDGGRGLSDTLPLRSGGAAIGLPGRPALKYAKYDLDGNGEDNDSADSHAGAGRRRIG